MTNRQRLARAILDLSKISEDDSISPTPFGHLQEAIRQAGLAATFVLDTNERDLGGQNHACTD